MKFLTTLFFTVYIVFCIDAQPGANDASFNPGDLGFGIGIGANNTVQSVLLQSDGKLIIIGNFTLYNSVARNRIARLNSDGSIDLSFDPGTGANNFIYSAAIQNDGKILIAGNFTAFNGTQIKRIARLNSNGSLDVTFNPGTGFNTVVRSMTLQSDGKIILGGNFTSFDGNLINRIARLNANGSLDNTFNVGTGANSFVYTTALQSDGKIILGGGFTTFDGTTANRIVRLNVNGDIDNTFNNGTGFNNTVSKIVVQSNSSILVAGNFINFNGTGRNRICRLLSSGSIDLSFNPGTGFNNAVNSLAIQSDGKIIAVGNYTAISGLVRNRIIRINLNGTVDGGFGYYGGANVNVFDCLLQPNGKIVVVGNYVSVNGVVKNRVAQLSSDGMIDPMFNPSSSANGTVQTVAIQSNGKIIVAGNFTSYFGVAKNRIMRVNTDGGLDATFLTGTGVNNWVYASAIQSDGKILIGGTFTNYNGTSRNRIVRLNVDGSIDLSFVIGTGFNNAVRTLSVQSDGKIIVGGGFTSYNGTFINRIARLNVDGSLDGTFNVGTGVNNIVFASAIQSDGKILIGGSFTNLNGITTNRLARLNTDGSVDATFISGTSLNNVANTIAIQTNGNIIIGGNFTSYNGSVRNRIVRILPNGSIDPSFNIGTGANLVIQQISLYNDGKIVCGGNFTLFNGITRNRLVRLNPTGTVDLTFDTSIGTNAILQTCKIQNNGKIVIGGSFTSYQGAGRNALARVENCSSVSSQATTTCNSYSWNGNVYTSSGLYNYVTTNVLGCDSTALLNLTINNSNSGIASIIYCNNYTWIDGVNYTSDNTSATYTLTNQFGCDSIVSLNLTIISDTNVVFGTDVINTCNAIYTWIDGVTYYANNNTATFVLPSQTGCDSTVTLNLTLNGTTGTDYITACNHYTWINGVNYTASNNFATHILTNQVGCDSLVTLNLTLNYVVVSVTNSPPNLTANLAGASYQWLNCENNYMPIIGQTGQTFVSPGFGSYAVKIDNGICVDTSDCFIPLISATSTLPFYDFVIFPNPTNGLFYIKGDEPVLFKILNIQGELILESKTDSSLFEINLTEEASGIYLVSLMTNKGTSLYRIVKQ